MLKPLILLLIFTSFFQSLLAQKKTINRKVAQKNYEGYMLMQEEKYDSALLFFNNALKSDPDAFFIYQNRALCKLYLKDTTGAIDDFKINIKLEPENAESKYVLGNIYKYKKDTLEAIKYFIPAINLADEMFSQQKLLYMNNFAGHYFEIKEDYDSALIFYNRVKIYDPQNVSSYLNSAVCHFKLDSLEQFCSDIEQAYILGGAVSCYVLRAFCRGCYSLQEQANRNDTASQLLDSRLLMTLDVPPVNKMKVKKGQISESESKKIKVYYNHLWQICSPENASYYREAFWAEKQNFFGGKYTDYYIGGDKYAEGILDKAKLKGAYQTFYKNGNIKMKGQFVDGHPTETWRFYLENGTPDFEIVFFFDTFKIKLLNKSDSTLFVDPGTGKFEILLDSWNDFDFKVKGEYFENERAGEWSYIQNNEPILWEEYKKGKFRKGYYLSNKGKVRTTKSNINSSTFIPPQITQVRNLFFDAEKTIEYYRFIKVSGF